MSDVITDFTPVSIKNASIQYLNGETQSEGEKFGCMGTLSAETEVRELVKRCEGEEEVVAIPRYMTVTVGAHIKKNVIRDIFGIKTEGLKSGVYSYGRKSKGKRFVFTADVIDEFEDIVQLIAFPRCSNMAGLTISIDNDVDDIPYVELVFRANADELGNFYYEAFVDELDQGIAQDWHKTFSADLVKDTTPEA